MYCILKYYWYISFQLETISADIAQLVELLICNQWVRGSSPCVGTTYIPQEGCLCSSFCFK